MLFLFWDINLENFSMYQVLETPVCVCTLSVTNLMMLYGSVEMGRLMKKMTKESARKTRKLSIRLKILLTTSILMIAVVILLGMSFYNRMNKSMIQMGIEQAEAAAAMAIRQVNGAEIASLKEGAESTIAYKKNCTALMGVKELGGFAFLYTLSTDGKQVYYGIDTDEGESKKSIGDVFETDYKELESVFNGKGYVQNYIDYTGDGAVITVYKPILDDIGNVVAVLGSDYDASGIVKNLNSARARIIEIGGIGILIALVLLNIVIGRITKSINLVNEKLYDLVYSEGDLTKTLEISSGDEMEQMAQNINGLLGHIRTIMTGISGNSRKLNESTQMVVENLGNAGQSVVDVSATMQEMSAAMEETTVSLGQISDSVSSIFLSINDISKEAAEGSSLTQEIQSKAQGIYKSAEREQADVQQEARRMETAVNEKIESSKAVSEIALLTEKIIEITTQTNLLSLNASIEAARAGEAGRGFAVVADEIGKLAADSAEAAARISQVSDMVTTAVEELSDESAKMVRFMEEITLKGYGNLLETSRDYSENAENINMMMERLAKNSELIQQSMDSIKAGIGEVNVAVEESTKGVQNISERSTALSDNIRDIGQKADVNQMVAGELEQEVGKFKI